MTTLETHSAGSPKARRGWTVALWVLQVLLAAMFANVAYFKLFTPAEVLAAQMADLPLGLIRFIGVAELAGALGLILPAATRILPWLTPVAALGLAAIMVLASSFHVLRGEFFALPMTLGLGVVAVLVVWGRLRKAPIVPRG